MRAAPEYKEPPRRVVRFVQVPRELVAHYADQAWADVIVAAQAARDGLVIIDANFYGLPYAAKGTAWLREGPTGGCLLYSQNWCDETDEEWRQRYHLV